MFLEEFKFLFRILGCIYYVLKSAHLRGSFVRFPEITLVTLVVVR
jgi:hypothetical protein